MVDTTGAAPGAGPQTHFGYSHVPLADKQRQVDAVFHDVASRYDLMNDLMSAGLHRLWKEDFVARIRPQRARPFHHLDVAGGTGDIAFRVARKAARLGARATDITVLDINAAMLREGRRRAAQGAIGGLRFVQANAEALPFPDGSFDAYTIAFGIRNVPRIDEALAEAHRVLRRGGRFLCLEFSDVDIPWLDRLYETYSFRVIPAVGKLVTGHAEAYQYLVESIRRFPEADAFRGMILRAGFARVTFTRMSGGIVAIHSGWKL